MSYRSDVALSFAGEDVLCADYLLAKERQALTSPNRAPLGRVERSDLQAMRAYNLYGFRASERVAERVTAQCLSTSFFLTAVRINLPLKS
jgi:hypothetical protein